MREGSSIAGNGDPISVNMMITKLVYEMQCINRWNEALPISTRGSGSKEQSVTAQRVSPEETRENFRCDPNRNITRS